MDRRRSSLTVQCKRGDTRPLHSYCETVCVRLCAEIQYNMMGVVLLFTTLSTTLYTIFHNTLLCVTVSPLVQTVSYLSSPRLLLSILIVSLNYHSTSEYSQNIGLQTYSAYSASLFPLCKGAGGVIDSKKSKVKI